MEFKEITHFWIIYKKNENKNNLIIQSLSILSSKVNDVVRTKWVKPINTLLNTKTVCEKYKKSI